MPSVKLSQEVFDTVRRLAAQQRTTPDEIVERSVQEYLQARERMPEQRRREWQELFARFDAVKHTDETEEEVFALLKEATSEVWAERLARSH